MRPQLRPGATSALSRHSGLSRFSVARSESPLLSATKPRALLHPLMPTGCGLGHGDWFVGIVRASFALRAMDAAVRPADTPRRGSGFHHA